MRKRIALIILINVLIVTIIFGQKESPKYFKTLIESPDYSNQYIYQTLKTDSHFQNLDSTLQVLTIIESKARQQNDSVFLAKLYGFTAGKHFAKGDYLSSLNYCNKSLKLYEAMDNTVEIAKAYNNLGIIYEITGDYKFAIKNHQKSLKIWHSINDPQLMSQVNQALPHVYSNLGVAYSNFGDQAKAIHCYKKGLELAHIGHQDSPKAFLLLNIGLVHSKLEDFDSALFYVSKSLFIVLKDNNPYLLVNIYNNLGLIYQKKGNADSSMYYFGLGLNGALQINALEHIKNAYYGFYLNYQSKGKYEEALVYLNLSKQIEDSIYANDVIRNLSEEKTAIENGNINSSSSYFHNYYLFLSIVSLIFIVFVARRRYLKYRITLEKLQLNDPLSFDISEPEFPIQNIENKAKPKLNLDQETTEEILLKLEESIIQKKMFKNGNLTIESLSKEINCSRSRISNVINYVYGKNFNNWINEFRIEEAKILLREPQSKNITIEAISQRVGFNSKSTFNVFFKSQTGLTPKQFMDQSL
jgi:AraC-like DNA-binding protein